MIVEFSKRIGVPAEVVLGRSLTSYIADVRYIYWKLMQELGYTQVQIARLNDRSLTGVYKGVKYINEALDMDDPQIMRLWDKVKDLPGEMEMEALELKVEN